MFPLHLLRRLTALIVVLALAAPAWTVCRTAVSGEPMAGMPCCHPTNDGTSSDALAGDCCSVQPDNPASSPLGAPTAPTVRVASPAVAVLSLAVSSFAPRISHDRRTEADSRGRPKIAPYLLDSVLLI